MPRPYRVDPLKVRDAIARRDAAVVLPSVRYPIRTEESYARDLLHYVREIQRDLMARLQPVLDRHAEEIDRLHDEQVQGNRESGAKKAAQTRQRADSAITIAAAILQVTREVSRAVDRKNLPRGLRRRRLERMAREVDGQATEQIDDIVREITLVDVFHDQAADDLYRAFARENVELIRSIPSEHFAKLEADINAALRSGKNTRQLTKVIEERYGSTKSRARMIARDQIGKANADVSQHRQEEHGVTRYQWSTSGDERVRERHAALEGTIHSWADPPVTNEAGDRNHPGEDYQCRCTADPVLDDDNIEELIAAGEERRSALSMK